MLQQRTNFISTIVVQMNSGKSSIKSKKSKLTQKKQQKQGYATTPIEIIQSSDGQDGPIIEKRRKNNTKPVQNRIKYNTFNVDRLKKVDGDVTKRQAKDYILMVEETQVDKPQRIPQINNLHTYKIQGNQSIKYVSCNYLDQRVKKIEQQRMQIIKNLAEAEQAKNKVEENIKFVEVDEDNIDLDQQEQKVLEELKQDKQEKQQKQERKRAVRYFQTIRNGDDEQNRLIKCYRCGKKGHISKNCLQERRQMKCFYCLGEHHHHDCNSRACFRCNQIGHISQQCKASGAQCRKCEKKGHIEKNCGTIVFLDYNRIKSDAQLRDRYHNEDLKKLRCLAGCKDPNGHFNCKKYHKQTQKIAQIFNRRMENNYQGKHTRFFEEDDFDRTRQRLKLREVDGYLVRQWRDYQPEYRHHHHSKNRDRQRFQNHNQRYRDRW